MKIFSLVLEVELYGHPLYRAVKHVVERRLELFTAKWVPSDLLFMRS